MRHLHLLDPQLADQGGHYLNHDFQLVREAQRRGLGVSLYGRRGGKLAECSGLPIRPVFSHDIFQEAGTDQAVWPLENFHAENEVFFQDLLRLDPATLSADDFVYFPNLLQNQVQGVTRWLRQLPAARRPAVALMFRYLNHAMDYVQQRQNKDMIALYYRFAVRELRGAHPRTLVCGDTTELARAYQQITGGPVVELPNPMDVSELLATAQARPANRAPVVVYQGHTSPLRGFHFLPEIIDRCARLQPRPRFVVQLQNRESALAVGLGPFVERLESYPADAVRLVPGALSPADYFGLLAEADIVLLPYSPTFYGSGSSVVFTEAASVGKVVVVSAGTVPARQGREYQLGVVTAAAWTPAAMAEAVATALQRLPALQRQSAAGAARFRAENCARAFWDKLLAAAETLPPVPAMATALA
ncbi:MAG: glycosyltransferase [Opitutae bacterium]|nr:glycosyltransferase [Opitutae bacterium]